MIEPQVGGTFKWSAHQYDATTYTIIRADDKTVTFTWPKNRRDRPLTSGQRTIHLETFHKDMERKYTYTPPVQPVTLPEDLFTL